MAVLVLVVAMVAVAAIARQEDGTTERGRVIKLIMVMVK